MMNCYLNPLSLRPSNCTIASGFLGLTLFINPVNAAELTSAFTISSLPKDHIVLNLKLSPEEQKSVLTKTENLVVKHQGKAIDVSWQPPRVLKAQEEIRVLLIGSTNQAKSGTVTVQFGSIGPLQTELTILNNQYASVHLGQSICRERSTPACHIEWIGIHERKNERYAQHFLGAASNTSITFAPVSWHSTSVILTTGNRNSRGLYDIQSSVLKLTRIQDTLIESTPASIALPWPKTTVAGTGIMDAEETFYLPLWVPDLSDESSGGRLYLLQQPRKGQPSFRKIGAFSSEAACKSVLDAVGKPVLLVSNNHQHYVFKVSTKGVAQIDLLPPQGNRLDIETNDNMQPILTDVQWSEDLDEGLTITRVAIFESKTDGVENHKLSVQRFSLSGAPLEKANILSTASSISVLSAQMRSDELLWTRIDNRQVLFHKRIPYSLKSTNKDHPIKPTSIRPLRVVKDGDSKELIFVNSTSQGPVFKSTAIQPIPN